MIMRSTREKYWKRNAESLPEQSAVPQPRLLSRASLCDKSISIRGFMRKTAVLIVLIKNMNASYSIHLRSQSANSFLRLVCRGAGAGRVICLRRARCVSQQRVSGCVF